MTRFVFHIGPHKTGTSYLQAGLRRHAAALEAAGVHVARLWEDSELNPSHTGLVERLKSERLHELQPVFAAWRKSSYALIVVSCEELATIAHEPVKVLMLRELTQGCEVSIVYFARRWTDLLASGWQEYVKQGRREQLTDVLGHNLSDANASRIINIDVTLGVYAEHFGEHSIKIISYDSVMEGAGDIFSCFAASFLGQAGLPAHESRVINARLTPAKTEMMRVFNCLQQESGTPSLHLLRFLMLEHAPAPLTVLLDHMAMFPCAIEVHDDHPAALHVLLENARRYRPRIVGPAPPDRLYEAKLRELHFIDRAYALTPGFNQSVRKLWRDLLDIAGTG